MTKMLDNHSVRNMDPISDENRNSTVKASKETLEQLQRDTNEISKDKDCYSFLTRVLDYLSRRFKTSKKHKNNKDEIKESENEVQTMGDMCKLLKNAANETEKWAKTFLKEIKTAKLKQETKKELIDVCAGYKTLLQSTSIRLQTYRTNCVKPMIDVLESILEVLIPPKEVYEDLKELCNEDKIKKIELFAKENKDELKDRLKNLCEQMKKNKNLKSLEKLISKWKKFVKKTNNLISKVKNEIQESNGIRQKMKVIIGISVIIGATLLVSLGTAGGVIGILMFCGMALGKVLMVGGGVVCTGVAAVGVLLLTYPEITQALNLAANKTTTTITDGLENISKQSNMMESLLFEIYKQWVEVMSNPNISYHECWGRVQASGLLKKLNDTKKGLEELKTCIEETENVCETQLSAYNKNIYNPLMEIY